MTSLVMRYLVNQSVDGLEPRATSCNPRCRLNPLVAGGARMEALSRFYGGHVASVGGTSWKPVGNGPRSCSALASPPGLEESLRMTM